MLWFSFGALCNSKSHPPLPQQTYDSVDGGAYGGGDATYDNGPSTCALQGGDSVGRTPRCLRAQLLTARRVSQTTMVLAAAGVPFTTTRTVPWVAAGLVFFGWGGGGEREGLHFK